MVAFLSSIADALLTVFDILFLIIKSLVQFIVMIPTWLVFLTTSVGYVPGVILPFIMFGISLSVILFLIGRFGK